MSFHIHDDSAIVHFRYMSFKNRKTVRKYFYKYIHIFGKLIGQYPNKKLFPYISQFVKIASDTNLSADLEFSTQSLFPYFYNAICDAERILRGDNEDEVQKIHREITRHLFSAAFERLILFLLFSMDSDGSDFSLQDSESSLQARQLFIITGLASWKMFKYEDCAHKIISELYQAAFKVQLPRLPDNQLKAAFYKTLVTVGQKVYSQEDLVETAFILQKFSDSVL